MLLLSVVNLCRLKPQINFKYPNLYKLKYLSSAFATDLQYLSKLL